MVQLAVSWSTTLSVTEDDSAPRTTGTFALMSFDAAEDETVMSVLSPESVAVEILTSLPIPPPGALMSLTASPAPAMAGGPRYARLPVSGSMVPYSSASWLGLDGALQLAAG